MQIKRNGVLLQTAYCFQKPSQWPTGTINGCTLLWRFFLFGIAKIIFNLFIIFIFGLIGGIALVIRFVWCLLFGKALAHTDHAFREVYDAEPLVWQWIEKVCSGVSATEYRSYPIHSWPTYRGFRLLPGVALLVLGGFMFEVSAFMYTIDQWQTRGIGMYTGETINAAVVLISLQLIAGFFLLVVVPSAWFLNSEPAKLLRARIRSFKDRTCPVVEVVE